LRAGRGHGVVGAVALAEQLLLVEARHQHAGRDAIAFVHAPLDELAGDLEGDIDFGEFDVA